MSNFFARYVGIGGGGGGGGVTSLDGLTGALTLVAGTGISIVDGVSTITIASTSAGDLTLTAFGSTPNDAGASLSGQALTLQPADATHPGGVSTTTQSFAGNKTFTGTIAASNLSGTNTGDLVLGTANGLSLIGQVLSLALSSNSTTGALSSIDWITFNGKQGAGNYITALTGDATATGPGSVALTLATVNANVGTFASVTVNAKGLVTAATALSGDATTSGAALTLATVNSNVGTFGAASQVGVFTVNAKGLVTAAANTSIQIAESQVTNLVTDLAAKQSTTLTNAHILVGNSSNVATDVAVSGDLTLANTGALTLNTVNSNVGSFGTATQVSTFTVNAKGLITAASNTAIAIPFSQVTGTVPINQGGTGQTTKAAAFDALSPMTAVGDTTVGGTSGTGTRFPVGTDNFAAIADSVQSLGLIYAPVYSNGDQNNLVRISTTVGSSALTVSVGTSLSSTNFASITFPAYTSGSQTGNSTVRVTSNLSMVVSSGSTLGQRSNVAEYIYVYLINNAGTAEIAVSSTLYDQGLPYNTTAEGGAGAADSRTAIYSSTARTAVPMLLVGRILITEATAGTWNTNASRISMFPFATSNPSGNLPSVTKYTSGSGTFTPDPRTLWLRVRAVAGGGAGAGSGTGTVAGINGGAGNNTTFGGSTAGGGGGGLWNSSGGSGGTSTLGSGHTGVALTGSDGFGASYANILNVFFAGGAGGSSALFGGGAAKSFNNAAGTAGLVNTGGGGQGGGNNGVSSSVAGSGGGAGGCIDVNINNPAASYSYTVGTGGTAGNAGTAGLAGGAGGDGFIIVEEYWV